MKNFTFLAFGIIILSYGKADLAKAKSSDQGPFLKPQSTMILACKKRELSGDTLLDSRSQDLRLFVRAEDHPNNSTNLLFQAAPHNANYFQYSLASNGNTSKLEEFFLSSRLDYRLAQIIFGVTIAREDLRSDSVPIILRSRGSGGSLFMIRLDMFSAYKEEVKLAVALPSRIAGVFSCPTSAQVRLQGLKPCSVVLDCDFEN